jgi:hypothetical protein
MFSQKNNGQAAPDEKHHRQHNLPKRELIVWMRVKDRQSYRAEHLPDIGEVTRKCIVQPPHERQLIDCGRFVALCQQSRHARKSGQGKQRNLFPYESTDHRPLMSDRCLPRRSLGDGGTPLC